MLLLVLTHAGGRGEGGGEACSPEGPRYTFYNIALYWQLVRYLRSAVQRDRLLYLTEKLRQKLPVITTACFVLLHDRINALTDRDIYQFSFYFHLAFALASASATDGKLGKLGFKANFFVTFLFTHVHLNLLSHVRNEILANAHIQTLLITEQKE